MDLKKYVKSKLDKEIVLFFLENPSSLDTPRGVSTWVKQDRARVEKVLNELTKSGILVAHRATSTTGYSLTRNKRIISQIKKIIGNYGSTLRQAQGRPE